MVRAWGAIALAGVVGLASSGLAFADGMDGKKKKTKAAEPAPAEQKSDLQITANVAATSEYVFRGFSQSGEDPTVQGGVDLTYKWFYAGIWASGLDFGIDALRPSRNIALIEMDFYAGIKPVLGRLNFDFGVIYYAYPKAFDPGGAATFRELDYVELKAGVSSEVWKDGTLGATVFWSPEYTNDTGSVVTLEGTFSQVLPKMRDIVPTFSATLGYQIGDDARFRTAIANNTGDDYLYWNAGMTLGFGDRFALDFRYWDTDIKNNNAAAGGSDGFCTGQTFQCDSRFVATAKVTY